MPQELQFMVDFSFPKVLPDQFLDLLPMQRNRANKLFREGKLVNLAIALDHSKMWAVFRAESLEEVEALLAELPLTPYLRYRICPLTVFSAVESGSPAFSLN
ncbi:MAG: hypothetical protein KatS3mg029_0755 [Saprospiraceae bacterium]|nr:MAG: hypothetical protein KatS3mg029_0755 [Saprospiraceae bacterium]